MSETEKAARQVRQARMHMTIAIVDDGPTARIVARRRARYVDTHTLRLRAEDTTIRPAQIG